MTTPPLTPPSSPQLFLFTPVYSRGFFSPALRPHRIRDRTRPARDRRERSFGVKSFSPKGKSSGRRRG